MNLNKVQLIGRLTRDPELKNLPSGVPVANFSIATNHVYYNQQKEKVEQVDFHNCVTFNKTAENLVQYQKKGNPIYVEGRLTTRSWDDKTTGEKKYRTEIMVETIQFAPRGSGGDRGDDGHAPNEEDIDFGTAPEKPKKKEKVEPKGMDLDTLDYGDTDINVDDIPF